MVDPRAVRVELGERGYDVVVSGGLAGLGARLRGLGRCEQVVVATDETVDGLWGAALREELDRSGIASRSVVLPPGEAHKDQAAWWRLIEGFLEARGDRRTPLLALGGGVVGDLAGFAAASVLRGVPFVQVPTTLLAMVDSSVGGKTGFNHPLGKNLVGAFYQPVLVWAAIDTLATLPMRERTAGLGEVLKTAWVADPDFVAWLEVHAEALRGGEQPALAEAVARCVAIKAGVVAEDEREGGRRAILNAGHTVGHGIEAAAGYGAVLHGEAVAIGMLAEARWAAKQGLDEGPEVLRRLQGLTRALGLPTAPAAVGAGPLSSEVLLAAMGLDKKTVGDMIVLPICPAAGRCSLLSLPVHRLPELASEIP
jgi:3-dehydroquinate synthase